MKPILTTLAFILISFSGFSQNTNTADNSASQTSMQKEKEYEPEFKYGIRGAYNISNLDFTPAPTFENKHRNNMAIGGFVEYFPSETFSILAELQYSAEGGAKDESLRVTYIQLPILFKYQLSSKLAIGVGPQVGLKTWSYEDGIKNFAFSGVGGLEYMLSDSMFLDARYTYGLTNILDNDSSFEARNTCIQLGIGLKLK